MKQPLHRLFDGFNLLTFAQQGRAIDHYNGQRQCARSLYFADRPASSGIFGHEHLNSVVLQQSDVILHRKRTTRYDAVIVRQDDVRRRLVDKPQKIMMMGMGCKRIDMHAPKGQHDALFGTLELVDRIRNTVNLDPEISSFGKPRAPFHPQKRKSQFGAGIHGIAAHLHSKRMGGIDNMGYGFFFEILTKSSNTTKTANTFWDRLGFCAFNTSRIGQVGLNASISNMFGQRARFAGSGKDQKVHGCV